MLMLPSIVKKSSEGYMITTDIASELFEANVITICDPIGPDVSQIVIQQLHLLKHKYKKIKDKKKKEQFYVTMLINSPGGSVQDGFGIVDTMRLMPYEIVTVGVGTVASMAATIYLAGDTRLSYPNTQYLLHQPLGGTEGRATDIEIYADNIKYIKTKLNSFIAERIGKSIEEIEKATSTGDFILYAPEAKEYGIVHAIYEPPKEKETKYAKKKLFGIE